MTSKMALFNSLLNTECFFLITRYYLLYSVYYIATWASTLPENRRATGLDITCKNKTVSIFFPYKDVNKLKYKIKDNTSNSINSFS